MFRAEPKADDSVQTWTLEKSGDAYYLKNVGTRKYLNAAGKGNGSNVLVTSGAGEQALWSIDPKTDSEFVITNVSSGILLSGSGNDSNVHLWENGDSPLQMWTVVEKGPAVEEKVSVTAPETVLANEDFEITAVTGSEVSRIKIFNENEMQIGLKGIIRTENGDGTVTWKVRMSIGTAGTGRTITLATADDKGEFVKTKASCTLDVVMPQPVVFTASTEESALVNRPVAITAMTDKTVTRLFVKNEYGNPLVQLCGHRGRPGMDRIYENRDTGYPFLLSLWKKLNGQQL